LFERLADSYPADALAVAYLQVDLQRRFSPLRHPSLRALRLAEALENVGRVADAGEAREALREARSLYQGIVDHTRGGFGRSRVERVDERLLALEDKQDAG
jgi:hypothetical protein